jgi:hypothetical protein
MKEAYIVPVIGDLIVLKKERKIRIFYGDFYEIPKDKLLIIVSVVGGSLQLLSGKSLGIWHLNLLSEQGQEYRLILRGGLVSEDSDLQECLFDSDVYLVQRKVVCIP